MGEIQALLGGLCAVPDHWAGKGLLLGLFLAGLAGSPMHCAPMCGGFVLGQAADRMAALPARRLCEWQRIGAGALLPYHLGRLTTYGGLGAIAGLGGAALSRLPWFGMLSGGLLLVAAGLFLVQALRRAIPAARRQVLGLDRVPPGWHRIMVRLIGWADRQPNDALGRRPSDGPHRRSAAGSYHQSHGYALGVALGFLPCGLLYAALAAAAASGNPWLGGLGLVAFGFGTAPALIAVGIAGHAAGRAWQRGAAAAAPAVMLLNAGLLIALAMQRLAGAV